MKILAFAPHPDDIELGCGGSVSKWIKEGHDFYAVSLSRRSDDESEFLNACRVLGIKRSEFFDFKCRHFGESRQQILDTMLDIGRDFSPDLVIIPSTNDTHQDHQVVRDEGFRAFKRVSLIGYEMPQNNMTFNTQMFVRLEHDDIGKKIEALESYRSQDGRPYLTREFIWSLSRVRGMQAGSKYAETFEVIRWIA